jgi:hypothetical protein
MPTYLFRVEEGSDECMRKNQAKNGMNQNIADTAVERKKIKNVTFVRTFRYDFFLYSVSFVELFVTY